MKEFALLLRKGSTRAITVRRSVLLCYQLPLNAKFVISLLSLGYVLLLCRQTLAPTNWFRTAASTSLELALSRVFSCDEIVSLDFKFMIRNMPRVDRPVTFLIFFQPVLAKHPGGICARVSVGAVPSGPQNTPPPARHLPTGWEGETSGGVSWTRSVLCSLDWPVLRCCR